MEENKEVINETVENVTPVDEVVEATEESILEDFSEEQTDETDELDNIENKDEEVVDIPNGGQPAETTPEPEEVTLDDLDDVPASEKLRKVKADEKIDVSVLTIANIKLGKPLTKDKDGKHIPPEVNNAGNKYYKAKVIVEFEEEINGDKIREFIPSIFYSVDEDGSIARVPTLPKACEDKKLNDNFTPTLSKLRNKHAKFLGVEAKTISSSAFLKDLINQKVSVTTESGEFKGRPWQKIVINDFVKNE